MEVLDTSAFIHEYTTDDTVVSVPEVHEELTGEGALRFDAMEGSGMTIHVPAPKSSTTCGALRAGPATPRSCPTPTPG